MNSKRIVWTGLAIFGLLGTGAAALPGIQVADNAHADACVERASTEACAPIPEALAFYLVKHCVVITDAGEPIRVCWD